MAIFTVVYLYANLSLTMNSRTKLLVGMVLIVIYMLSGFTWWTYSLVKYGKNEYDLNMKLYASDSVHLAGAITHNILSSGNVANASLSVFYKNKTLPVDTFQVKKAVSAQYKNYDFYFLPNKSIEKSFIIQIKPETQKRELNKYKRKRNGWIGEGIVLGIILFVISGIVYFYLDKMMNVKQQQNNFLLAITHELKTPIAASKLAIQSAAKQVNKGNFSNLDNFLFTADKNLNRLSKLMDDVLVTTRLDAINKIQHSTLIKIPDLIAEVARETKESNLEEIEIRINIEIDYSIYGDYEMMKLTLTNLVSNAIKYSNQDSPIKIEMGTKKRDKYNCVYVSDYGQGIPDDEKKKIFRLFYRIGNERTRNSPGTGLGLHLVRKIVRQHNAIIFVEDNKPKGSVFIIASKSKKSNP